MATAADTNSAAGRCRGNRECPISSHLSAWEMESRFLALLSNAGKQSRQFGSIKFPLNLTHNLFLSIFSFFFVSPPFVVGIKSSGKTVI